MACPGIGHIKRGFESFTSECFEAMKDHPDVELWLAKGAGPSQDKEIKIRCLKRNKALSHSLALLIRRDSYFVEQATFALGLIPFLITKKPELVFFSDGTIGNV